MTKFTLPERMVFDTDDDLAERQEARAKRLAVEENERLKLENEKLWKLVEDYSSLVQDMKKRVESMRKVNV